MWLKYCPHAFEAHLLCRRKRCRYFRRVVRKVISNSYAAKLPKHFKTPVHTCKGMEAFLNVSGVYAEKVGNGKSREGIVYVVFARNAEGNICGFIAAFKDAEFFMCTLRRLYICRTVIICRLEAVSHDTGFANAFYGFHGISVVAVYDDSPACLCAELVE